ncbi:MAG: alpha/beta hydrolase-fold protein [Bacteroidales bacterium]
MKVFLAFILTTIYVTIQAQVTFTLVSIPDYTPEGDQIFIGGNFNGWNPGDAQYVLEKNNDDLWEITLDGFSEGETIQFKFTRGNWETVEKGAEGEEIGNRSFTFGNGQSVDVTILNWADNNGGGDDNSTAAENVHIMSEDFYIPQLDRNRRIWIYLPPDYDQSGNNYPVIYMHDGQNLFDVQTAFLGEWEVDETFNDMASRGYNVPIVVGIDNGGIHRANEYLPYFFEPLNAGGEGDEFMAFIVETLKPHIDNEYRTMPGRESTGIIGSSFGGVISFYGALKYQDVFSKCAPFSPAYWANYEHLFADLAETGLQHDVRFYQNAGENEGDQYIQAMHQMEEALNNEGFNNTFSTVIAGGNHNEATWAGDLENAYLWLFPEYSGATGIDEGRFDLQPVVYPNPAEDILNLKFSNQETICSIRILGIEGEVIREYDNVMQTIYVGDLNPGIYFISVHSDDRRTVESFIKL